MTRLPSPDLATNIGERSSTIQPRSGIRKTEGGTLRTGKSVCHSWRNLRQRHATDNDDDEDRIEQTRALRMNRLRSNRISNPLVLRCQAEDDSKIFESALQFRIESNIETSQGL